MRCPRLRSSNRLSGFPLNPRVIRSFLERLEPENRRRNFNKPSGHKPERSDGHPSAVPPDFVPSSTPSIRTRLRTAASVCFFEIARTVCLKAQMRRGQSADGRTVGISQPACCGTMRPGSLLERNPSASSFEWSWSDAERKKIVMTFMPWYKKAIRLGVDWNRPESQIICRL